MSRTGEHHQPVGDPVEWAGARVPEPSALEGRLVRLEPLAAEHADPIFATLAPHPELWTYRPDEPPDSVAEAARQLAHEAAGTDRVGFAIVPVSSGTLEGLASYSRIQPEVGSIEVGGVLYAPSLQRTAAATEAMYLMMRHAFEELGYRRYEWKCDSLNAASRRAALRLGFTEEGTFRHAMVTKGRNRDTTWFSVVDREWPLVGGALAAWLAEDNLDHAGRQRRSLAQVRDALAG